MDPQFGRQPCEVLNVEDEKLFSYSFAPQILHSTITWRLSPEGNGTRLFLEHSGFDLDNPICKMAYQGMSAGWPKILKGIESAI